MARDRALLAQPHLSVVSGEPDFDLQQIARIIAHSVIVAGRTELERLLDRLLAEVDHAAPIAPKTLDLIGHSRSTASLLSIGDWIVDGADLATVAWFRGLADREVLPRLGVRALRLLGCRTAGTAPGRATIAQLREVLGLEVLGTTQLLSAGHYDAGGFRDGWRFLLAGASPPRHDPPCPGVTPARAPYPRVLDLDTLPAVALGLPAAPRRIASEQAAQQIVQLVRPGAGARLAGSPPPPEYELALPSGVAGAYHVAHVLYGGAFLRFYPGGMSADGIVFPVEDAGALRLIIAALPPDPEPSR